MIKVGDKVILDGVEYFVNDIRSGSVSLYKGKNPLSVMFMNEKTLCAKLYEQQKQRADELEKRWSNLKSFIGLRNAQTIYECLDAEEITNGILKYIDLLEDNNA